MCLCKLRGVPVAGLTELCLCGLQVERLIRAVGVMTYQTVLLNRAMGYQPVKLLPVMTTYTEVIHIALQEFW